MTSPTRSPSGRSGPSRASSAPWRPWAAVACLLAAGACGGGDSEAEAGILDGSHVHAACASPDNACPAGQTCIAFARHGSRCADTRNDGNYCGYLDCGGQRCSLAESSPPQVSCAP